MRTIRVALLSAAIAILIAACGGGGPNSPSGSAAGSGTVSLSSSSSSSTMSASISSVGSSSSNSISSSTASSLSSSSNSGSNSSTASSSSTTSSLSSSSSSAPLLSLVAGNPNGAGNLDGSSTYARFFDGYYSSSAVAVDASGSVYVADSGNNSIRKITPDGAVTTFAGSPFSIAGAIDAEGINALFNAPVGISIDGSGNLYVADNGNYVIRKISVAGVVTTLAGLPGTPGYINEVGTNARFSRPTGIASDSAGNVYVVDSDDSITFGDNSRIRKITPTGVVTTFASLPTSGAWGIAIDINNNLYITDRRYNTILKVTSGGTITTLAGSPGVSGWVDATGINALFNGPTGIAVDAVGNVFVADYGNHAIRKITATGVVSTAAGSTIGSADGTGGIAQFSAPTGMTIDLAGKLYVADSGNNNIRVIDTSNTVTTLAGGFARNSGMSDGKGTNSRFSSPSGIVTDGAGNIYVADTSNSTIRRVTANGDVTTLAGGGIKFAGGSGDGSGANAMFFYPMGLATDIAGNIYVADTFDVTVRKVTPAGVVNTLAGGNGEFNFPTGVVVDEIGNVYVTDAGHFAIKKITPAGVITTIAGGQLGYESYEDGTGGNAKFWSPQGITADTSGNLFITDCFAIRKITPTGVVTTIAGAPFVNGYVDGTGSNARFSNPVGITIDSTGNLYVADSGNNAIRKITPAGVVTTAVGLGGKSGFVPGSLPGIISHPRGVAIYGTTLYVTIDDAVISVSSIP